jgi:hypothetical protein
MSYLRELLYLCSPTEYGPGPRFGELAAAGVVDGDGPGGRWRLRPAAGHPLLDAVDLRGAHDFRHAFSTWLEDAGIPAWVIDEVMGHQATGRAGRHRGSAIGAHYRHTTPEMAARVVTAIEERLAIVVQTAEATLDNAHRGQRLEWPGSRRAPFAGRLLAEDPNREGGRGILPGGAAGDLNP